MKSLLELKHELDEHIIQEKSLSSKPGNFTLPSSVYSSIERYTLEMKALEKFPRVLGPLSELKRKGDYIVSESGPTPKVFYNSCPHRGARLEADTATGKFVCPYHGWTFGPDGILLESTGHPCPFTKGSLKLREVPIRIIGGMVFTGDFSEEDDQYLKEIQHYSLRSHYLESRDFEVKSNWKFLVDSLLETYHFPFAHQSLLGGKTNYFFSMGTSSGLNSRMIVPLDNFDEAKGIEGFQGINIMYYLFPYSFVLFMSVGYVCLQIVPVSVDRCRIEFSLFSFDSDGKGNLDMLVQILNQDFEIVEGQQKNTSEFQRYCFTGYERLIYLMHRNIDALIGSPKTPIV